MATHLDVLIVGAGISGIGAAYHLQTSCPGKTYAILEARDATRRDVGPVPLPGHPLGLGHVHARLSVPAVDAATRRSPTARRSSRTSARPPRRTASTARSATATASSARAGRADGAVDGRRPRRARRRRSHAHVQLPLPVLRLLRLRRRATRPSSPGRERFRGRIVHPQHWPQDIDYAGKRVVVIGSGATAVTLVPDAREAAPRTSRCCSARRRTSCRVPARDPIADWLRSELPADTRVRDHALEERAARHGVLLSTAGASRSTRSGCSSAGREAHRCPTSTSRRTSRRRYKPWDQRLCLVPDADLFEAIARGHGLGRHRSHRDVHRDAASSCARARARRRHHRHRDRARAAGASAASRSTSTASRSSRRRRWSTRA